MGWIAKAVSSLIERTKAATELIERERSLSTFTLGTVVATAMAAITRGLTTLLERLAAASRLQESIESGNAIVYTTTYDPVYANDGSIVVVASYGDLTPLVRKVPGTATLSEQSPGTTTLDEKPQGDTVWEP